MLTREQVIDALNAMSPGQQRHLARKMELAKEYAVDFDAKRAAEAVGCFTSDVKGGAVQEAVTAIAADLDERSDLRAEYVRSYIRSILDFCPTDYFFVAEDGDWAIDAQQFSDLPPHIKRLVESVDMRFVRGRPYVSVKFVSKSQALALAARYTLTQKIDATVRTLPWDQLADVSTGDAIEDRIRGLQLLPRPAEAG